MFQRREEIVQVAGRFLRPHQSQRGQAHGFAAAGGKRGPPLAVAAIEDQEFGSVRQTQDIAEIIGLRPVERDRGARR